MLDQYLQVAPLIIRGDWVSSVAIKACMKSILPGLTDLEPLNLYENNKLIMLILLHRMWSVKNNDVHRLIYNSNHIQLDSVVTLLIQIESQILLTTVKNKDTSLSMPNRLQNAQG